MIFDCPDLYERSAVEIMASANNNILNYIMRGHKGKFDTSKPFKIMASRQQFEALQATDKLFPQSKAHSEQHQEQSKEQIVVPKIQTVPRITERKPFARIPLHYIRLPSFLNLPRIDAYELSEVDCLFLKGLRKKYCLEHTRVNEIFLRRVIVELETKAGRDNVLPRNKGWVVSFIERQYKRQLIPEPIFEAFSSNIYNYWRSRREDLKFPLYRPLWRPAENQFNHMLAFKAREKNFRNLRRTNRVDESDIIQQLYDEYHNVAILCERIQMREELKVKNIQLQILSFAKQCREFIDADEQYENMIPEEKEITDHRDKLKKMRGELQDFKRRRENIDLNQNDVTITKEAPNQRESIANFLASVVYEADKLGISHDNIFQVVENLPFLKNLSHQSSKLIDEIPQFEQEKADEAVSTHMFSIKKYGDLLVRSFSEDQDEEQYAQPPKDFLDNKRKALARSYFGEDDNLGQFRDLRKVISSSFKRFLQLSRGEQE